MKIIKIIAFASLLLFTVVRGSYAEQEIRKAILHPKGLLWKIEKLGQPPSYLYGTMHVGDSRVTTLASEVEQAFVSADHFVMEVIMDSQAMAYIARASFFNDGRSLDKIMSHLEFKKLADLLDKRLHLPEDVVKNMKPWAVLMLLMKPVEQQVNVTTTLDILLLKRASKKKINVTGLETVKEQISIFDSMNLQDQLWLLNRSIDDISATDAQMSIILDAYVDRDLAKLVEIQQQFMYEGSKIDDRLMEQLIDVRNKRFVERMQPILMRGNCFIAIGALHLPGEKGVLHLLEQQKFIISSVY